MQTGSGSIEDRPLNVDIVAAVARSLGDRHMAEGSVQVGLAISYRSVAHCLRADRLELLGVKLWRYGLCNMVSGADKLKHRAFRLIGDGRKSVVPLYQDFQRCILAAGVAPWA